MTVGNKQQTRQAELKAMLLQQAKKGPAELQAKLHRQGTHGLKRYKCRDTLERGTKGEQAGNTIPLQGPTQCLFLVDTLSY